MINDTESVDSSSAPITACKVRMCKICLEKDQVNQLISPCHCKGSIKYVHPHCMAGWRKALMQTGREDDLYHCQLCKHRLWVKQKRLWAALLHYKIFRVLVAASLLGLILIPAGSIMKAFIHFSVLLTNHPGGLTQAWETSSLTRLLFDSSQTSILASISPSHYSTSSTNSTSIRVLYSPFPVCILPSPASTATSASHALFSNQILYYFLFPFSDERLWQLILCKLEHFHLGFFLLGSVNNIYFTYRILNDMFDIVLLGQDQQDNDDDVQEDEEQRLNSITRRLSKLLKGFLLTYCCSLVILFWIHFNIFAFHVDSQYEYTTSKQFVAELPLWTLRWVTLGIAVGDFAARGIYRWLTRITNCVDQEDVLSLPENIK
ncbi:hypothetical protein BD408DRAFT_419707 [Parasitella parasitica]|nr:hypothetical protein BD408DRAFT_419707 [Parasitella parasitica]